MATKNLKEVRNILISTPFEDWCARYRVAYDRLLELRNNGTDRVERALLRVGEYEGLVAQTESALQEIDDGFEQLGEFELQRQRTTEVWVQSQSAEESLLEARAQSSELRQKLQALFVGGGAEQRSADEARLRSELTATETKVASEADRCEALRAKLEKETAVREALWEKVQDAWLRAVRVGLARAEYAYLARRTSANAALMKPSDPSGESSERPPESAEKSVADLIAVVKEAEQAYGAIMIEEFLYWPLVGGRSVLCVPLHDHFEHLNVQLKALQVYSVEDRLGLDWIEPLAKEDEPEDDPRLDAYFQR